MTTIYLDMDGVLADFNTGARLLLNASKDEQLQVEQTGLWPRAAWQRLAHVPNLYRNLPKMPLADDLVSLALRFRDEFDWKVAILTAVPKNNDVKDAFQDKFDWIAEHYPTLRMYFGPYSQDKHTHAKPGDILIDDRTSNCTEWQRAGGIAIQVNERRYSECIEQLAEIFKKTLAEKELGR